MVKKIFILIFFIFCGSIYSSDRGPDSKIIFSGEVKNPAEGPSYTGVHQGSFVYPPELDLLYKQAVESGNMLEAKRIEFEIKKYQAVQEEDKNSGERPQAIGIGFNPPFNPYWYNTDVTVYTGNLTTFGGWRRIATVLGEDYNLYLACVTPQISGTSHVYVYRSSNGGATWGMILDIFYGGGYFGEISLLAEKRHATLDDSTRIILYYTYSANSSLNDARLGMGSCRRDGSAAYVVNDILTPASGHRISYPSAMSDGAFWTTGTYFGVVCSEENNTSGVVSVLRYARTTTWGTSHTSVTWNTTFDDRYPSAAFVNKSSDSVWIAVERRLSGSNYLVRVIASPWAPSTSFYTYFIPPSDPGVLYEKPCLSVYQNSNMDSAIITVTRDGVAYYHDTPNGGGTWYINSILGGPPNGNNKLWTWCNVTWLGVGSNRVLGIWGSNDGDSLNIRRGVIGNLGSTIYKRNSNNFSTSVSPVGAIYTTGASLYSYFAYAGFGPQNLYANQENLVTAVNPIGSELPEKYYLSQNYPNPFNPVTNIRFSLVSAGNVKLSLYDVLGREIKIVLNEFMNAGKYEVSVDMSSMPSGTYFYRIEAGNFIDVKKMILIK